MLTPYFGKLGPNLDTALQLPVAGLHVDVTRSSEELVKIATQRRSDLSISLGVVDGRNVWRADLSRLLDRIEPLVDEIGSEHAMLATSCSLLHVPLDLDAEPDIDSDVKRWLAFAHQKIEELALLARALDHGHTTIQSQLDACDAAIASRHMSGRTSNSSVRRRVAEISPSMEQRRSPYARRRAQQRTALSLPAFPTTTIGSFPQTQSVRQARAAHAKGVIGDDAYDEYLRQEIRNAIRWQEELDLDVFVHGEFERNDMVQYFAEQLDGYAITKNAWVQSYGSRCVRPPVIYGDVARPRPMTVAWSTFAQSLTSRIMKGMLTGPVTMLKWSFVRDDLPAADVCRQIAFAIRDEVLDLEAAGIRVIQIDEPALREGLPLRRGEWPAYLAWAVQSFRLAASGVDDATQIHTHMCYAEFNDIIEAIGAMDADVISIETARSKMELLNAFATYRYPNEIGPGVYDIHAPRCPSIDEMLALAERANAGLSPEQIWINPDCGLKTRTWEEVRPALANMVSAAKRLRARQL
jgi:5-methyltetrahydropteroyltriglutamate--homocysteine methyltransferase